MSTVLVLYRQAHPRPFGRGDFDESVAGLELLAVKDLGGREIVDQFSIEVFVGSMGLGVQWDAGELGMIVYLHISRCTNT